jgi:hypothetical protein
MTAEGMITEIIQCFVPPPRPMIEKMKAFAEKIPDDCRQEVIDRILETEGPSSKVGVKQMAESCAALGVGFKRSQFVPAIDWCCDACGHRFKYAQSVSEDDKIDKYLYDFCPMCGFQPGWTHLREAYHLQGIATDWYDRLIEEHASSFGPKIKEHKVKKGGLNLFRGGLFWNIDKARAERAEDKKIEVAAKLAMMDRAKKFE